MALNGACVPQPQTDGRTTLTVAVNGEGTHATTTRERLLNRGHQFVREHGRIPTLREFRYWRKMILTEFGTFPDYIIALGFQPANNAGVRVPAAPILEAVAEALGMSEIGADPDIGTQVVLGKHLARQLRRMRQQGYVTEKTADEILCRIGRPDLWHTDPRLYGVGCVPFAGPAHAYLPDEAA